MFDFNKKKEHNLKTISCRVDTILFYEQSNTCVLLFDCLKDHTSIFHFFSSVILFLRYLIWIFFSLNIMVIYLFRAQFNLGCFTSIWYSSPYRGSAKIEIWTGSTPPSYLKPFRRMCKARLKIWTKSYNSSGYLSSI